MAFGSDGMPFSPRVGVQAAVHHVVPDERITLDEAVFAYTHEAARSLHVEQEVGDLSVGRWAAFLYQQAPWRDLLESPWHLQIPGQVPRQIQK